MNLNHRDGDGYRTHVNPDGSGCWLEGHPLSDVKHICPRGITRKLDNCIKRLGLVLPPSEWVKPFTFSTHPVRRQQAKLARIWRLECELNLQEQW